MKALSAYQNFYFVGIGGIGMSALARYFHFSGKNVLGYDKTQTKLTQAMQNEGLAIGFEDIISDEINALKPEDTLVIYTPAIKTLGILDFFAEKEFTILKRAKVLGLITQNTNCIAVAGTHGKTTTSTLVAHLCKEANLPFSCFLGGISENFNSNFYFNGNEISVLEADEYDRSFLNLSPDWAIVTSIDADHLDIYGDKATIESGFREFAALVPKPEQLFVKKGVEIGRPHKTYAVHQEADYHAENLEIKGDLMFFDIHHQGEIIPFSWQIPGLHNVENATAAIGLLHSFGVDFKTLQEGLKLFKGIKRRYTKHIFPNGKIYIDDYAHHPTELNAVLDSVRRFNPGKKVLVVFQPHLFSRTRDFADNFAESLAKGDDLLLLDIYPARELQTNFPGITSQWLLDKVKTEHKQTCSLAHALDIIKNKNFDIVITVGAGNIDTLYDPIMQWLSQSKEGEDEK